MATPTKRAMVAAMRAAGDKEGNGEGGESDGDAYEEGEGGDEEGDGEGGKSDGDGDKEGDGEEEGEGPHSSSSSDRLPPRHMPPLLLRLATAFHAVVGAAPGHSFGISSAAASASAAARQHFQTSDSHI